MRKAAEWRTAFAFVLIFVTSTGLAQTELGYDPSADPFEQLAAARHAAAADGKLILIIAGGEWCSWCHYLHAFLDRNPDVNKALKDTFVVVKTYFQDAGDNEAFYATLPRAVGYPHFWILDSDGGLRASQNTVELEDGGRSYDKDNFLAFIEQWRAEL